MNNVPNCSSAQMIEAIQCAIALDMEGIGDINRDPEPQDLSCGSCDAGADWGIMQAIIECRQAIADNESMFTIDIEGRLLEAPATERILRRMILVYGELTGVYPEVGI